MRRNAKHNDRQNPDIRPPGRRQAGPDPPSCPNSGGRYPPLRPLVPGPQVTHGTVVAFGSHGTYSDRRSLLGGNVWTPLDHRNPRNYGESGSGRGPDAGRTIEFKETDADGRGPDAGVAVSPSEGVMGGKGGDPGVDGKS
eukprot:gene18168-biopygen861